MNSSKVRSSQPREPRVPYLLRIALVFAALLVAACAMAARTNPPDDSPASATHAARIIVKVRDARRLDTTYTDLQHQARQAGATLTYFRTLQGDVHMYEIHGADADTLAQLLQRFGAHANVEYAEPDRIMRHQPPRLKKQ